MANVAESLLTTWLCANATPAWFPPQEFRLSESGACPRRRVLRALGYPGRVPSDEELATFAEGHLMEDFLAKLCEEVGLNFERQVPVKVRLGNGIPEFTGHIDFLIHRGRGQEDRPLVLECKTVNRYSAAFGLPKQEHLLQVQSYLHFGGYSEGEVAYWLKGRRLEVRSFPVSANPEVGQRIEDELRNLWRCVEDRQLPDIPAGHESDRYPCYWKTATEATEHFCEMWDHCWADKAAGAVAEPKAVGSIPHDTILRFADLKQRHSRLYVELEEVKRQIREMEPELVAALGGQAGLLAAEDITVKGSPVKGRVTYDVEAAILAGAVSEAALAPFRKEGQGYWKWTVTTKGGNR